MMKQNQGRVKNSKKKGIFYFTISLVLLLLLFLIVYKLSHKVYKQNEINVEISGLEGQIRDLNQENQDLNELISYLQTSEFREREAKDKLSLIKEGEKLVIVKEEDAGNKGEIGPLNERAEVIVHRENYYYWWHYFFSIKAEK